MSSLAARWPRSAYSRDVCRLLGREDPSREDAHRDLTIIADEDAVSERPTARSLSDGSVATPLTVGCKLWRHQARRLGSGSAMIAIFIESYQRKHQPLGSFRRSAACIGPITGLLT